MRASNYVPSGVFFGAEIEPETFHHRIPPQMAARQSTQPAVPITGDESEGGVPVRHQAEHAESEPSNSRALSAPLSKPQNGNVPRLA